MAAEEVAGIPPEGGILPPEEAEGILPAAGIAGTPLEEGIHSEVGREGTEGIRPEGRALESPASPDRYSFRYFRDSNPICLPPRPCRNPSCNISTVRGSRWGRNPFRSRLVRRVNYTSPCSFPRSRESGNRRPNIFCIDRSIWFRRDKCLPP